MVRKNENKVYWKIICMCSVLFIAVFVLFSIEAAAKENEPDFQSLIWNSLIHNRPVLLHARTEYLPYYKGHSSRHYLSLDWYGKEPQKVRIKDCNYNPDYNGDHIVPVTKAYECVHEIADRYVISSN